jgi:hypothetical protein
VTSNVTTSVAHSSNNYDHDREANIPLAFITTARGEELISVEQISHCALPSPHSIPIIPRSARVYHPIPNIFPHKYQRCCDRSTSSPRKKEVDVPCRHAIMRSPKRRDIRSLSKAQEAFFATPETLKPLKGKKPSKKVNLLSSTPARIHHAPKIEKKRRRKRSQERSEESELCFCRLPLPPTSNTQRKLRIPLHRNPQILIILNRIKVIIRLVFILNNQRLFTIHTPIISHLQFSPVHQFLV